MRPKEEELGYMTQKEEGKVEKDRDLTEAYIRGGNYSFGETKIR